MTWRRAVLLPMLVALWACADGGSRGSGISTDVFGNVVSVQPAASTAETDLAGIAVTIEGTSVAGQTDDAGAFKLRGEFDGMVTIVFSLPNDSGAARLDANVPAGGRLTLNNVDVDAQQGTAVAESADVDFAGIITAANCTAGSLIMTSSPTVGNDVDKYIIDLNTSSLQSAHGVVVPCSAVHPGQHASVQGMVNSDGSFGEATIVLAD